VPAGGISATNVQAALNELDTEKYDKTGGPITGSMEFVGASRRITGDMSSTPIGNRLTIQSSIVNGSTLPVIMPNGTATIAGVNFVGASDATNASIFSSYIVGNTYIQTASKSGTGTYGPQTFYTSDAERLRLETDGRVLAVSPAGMGYGIGAGGTAVQATSKSTAVMLNKPCGKITMNASALGPGAIVNFDINNTVAALGDTATFTGYWGPVFPGNYRFEVSHIINGIIGMRVTNLSAGALSEAVEFVFQVHKGALS
jgi:hypothetical protein